MKIVADVRAVQAAIDGTIKKLRNMKGVWDQVGFEVLNSIEDNFDAEGRPEKWQPLAPATIEGKVRKFGGRKKRGGLRAVTARKLGGNKILTDSGDLRRSIVHKADSMGVTIGSTKEYAAIHQFGGQCGRGRSVTIPARPYLMLQDGDHEKIVDLLEASLAKEWK